MNERWTAATADPATWPPDDDELVCLAFYGWRRGADTAAVKTAAWLRAFAERSKPDGELFAWMPFPWPTEESVP